MRSFAPAADFGAELGMELSVEHTQPCGAGRGAVAVPCEPVPLHSLQCCPHWAARPQLHHWGLGLPPAPSLQAPHKAQGSRAAEIH